MTGTRYPTGIDGNAHLPLVIDDVSPIMADDVNRLRNAIIAVERELGANPSGGFGTVASRLDSLEAGEGGGGGGSMIQASYLLFEENAELPDSRVFEVGPGLSLTDGGAGTTLTLSLTAGGSLFAHEGNTFGETAILGTNDAFGLEFETNNISRLSIGSTGSIIINDSGADADLRIEGDTDSNLLFVDASTDRIGIGTASPTALSKLSVSGGNIDIAYDVNGGGGLISVNPNAGANAFSLMLLGQSIAGGQWFQSQYLNSGYTPAGLNLASQARFLGGPNATGGLLFATMSASAPITFAIGNDLAANRRLDIRSTEVVINDNGESTVDFRVESDTNANMFFVDASADRIGIGTSSPQNIFHLEGNSAGGMSRISNTNTSGFSNIDFYNNGTQRFSFGHSLSPFGQTQNNAYFYSTNSNLVVIANDTAATAAYSNVEFSGAGTVFNEVGVDLDFRIESDTMTHALFVDGATGFVGVGGVPDDNLDVMQNHNGATSVNINNTTPGTASRVVLGLSVDASGNNFGQFQLTSASFTPSNLQLPSTLSLRSGTDTSGGLQFATNHASAGVTIHSALGFATNERANFKATTEVVFNDPGNDYDFRVESDTDANMVFVDAGNNSVGFGTASPSRMVHVKRDQDAATYLAVSNNSTGTGAYAGLFVGREGTGLESGGFIYDGPNTPSGVDGFEPRQVSIISNDTGGLGFMATNAAGPVKFHSGGNALANERLRFKATGEAVFNDVGADYDFRIESDANANMFFVDASANKIGVGTNAPFDIFEVSANQNARTFLTASNTTSGTAAQAGLALISNSGRFAVWQLTSDTFTPDPPLQPSQMAVNVDANSTNGMIFITQATNAPMRFHTGGLGLGFDRLILNGTTEAVFNEEGQNYDLRIESDTNANMFFVDASQNNIGIGSAPVNDTATKLHIRSPSGGTNLLISRGDDGGGSVAALTFSDAATGLDSGLWQFRKAAVDDPTNPSGFTFSHFPSGVLTKLLSFNTDSSVVINDEGVSTVNFRIESDTNANMFFVNASTNRVGIGTVTPGATFDIQAGTQATTIPAFGLTSTLANPGSTEEIGAFLTVTSAGASNSSQIGFVTVLAAGYTGLGATYALDGVNAARSAGTGGFSGLISGNLGFQGVANGTTVGDNIGGSGFAEFGDRNIGLVGRSQGVKVNAINVAVFGNAQNSGGGTEKHIGGLFTIGGAASDPTFETAALIADNRAETAPIFIARDNGSAVLTIADGGDVSIGTSSVVGKLTVSGSIAVTEIAAPGAPASGFGVIYEKSDGLLYFKNDAGTEFDLTATGGGGPGAIDGSGAATQLAFWSDSDTLDSDPKLSFDGYSLLVDGYIKLGEISTPDLPVGAGLLYYKSDGFPYFASGDGYHYDLSKSTFDYKPVHCASTASLTLSGTQTIDGFAAIAGHRVLVKNQFLSATNGIYVVAAGAWARADDMPTGTVVYPGTQIHVINGTFNGRSQHYCINNSAVVVGSTGLNFGGLIRGYIEATSINELVINDTGSSTIDFRIEGDTASNLFFVDASDDRIGVNRTAGNVKATFEVDNLAAALPIFIANDNGTEVFRIADGGAVTTTGLFTQNGGAQFNTLGSSTADFTVAGDTKGVLLAIDASADRVGINRVLGTFGATLDIDNNGTAESVFIARDNGTAVMTIADGGSVTLASTASATTALTVAPATTSGGAGAELVDVALNLSRTVTRVSGDVTTQRSITVTPPTFAYAFGGGVITDAYTFAVTGAPATGANTTITRSWAAQFGGSVKFDAGVAIATASTAASTSMTFNQEYMGVTSTAAPRTITLPASAACSNGQKIIIKDESGAASINAITIAAAGADTIDGAATTVINANYNSKTLILRGTNWNLV